jgi:cyclic pyranopterin phosphate synthase
MPEEGINFVPHREILSYEEMLHLVNVATQTGIRKVRLTGGEPLVRKGFRHFLDKLSQVEALEEISITTNGVLLRDFAADIRNCGICRLNISLDSLKAERFFQITRRDCFDKVYEGIQEAERLGFDPLKINVVAMKGINDDEIMDFARLTLEKPYHIRFIEFMPVGDQNSWSTERFISTPTIYDRVQTLGHLKPVEHNGLDGPAERYKIEGAKGEIGLIGALSNHFCDTCNRLRLTADGHLRACLFSDREIDIKAPLREGKPDAQLVDVIKLAIKNKPKGHAFHKTGPRKCVRQMSSIGG